MVGMMVSNGGGVDVGESGGEDDGGLTRNS